MVTINPSSQTQLQGNMQRTTCSSLYPNGQNRISVNLKDQMFREQGRDGDHRHFMAGNMQYPLTSIPYPTQQVSQAYHNDMGYQQATHRGKQKYGGPFQTEFDEPMNMNLSCRPGRWMQHSTSRPHYNEPRPKLPVYDGRSEWQSFIVPFNLLAERYDWGKTTTM